MIPVKARNFATSRQLLERARHSLAGGVSSPFRTAFPVPLYFADGRGAHLTDADGNDVPGILNDIDHLRVPRARGGIHESAQGCYEIGSYDPIAI